MSKIVRQNPTNPDSQPEVYKQAELEAMLQLIDAGVWRSTNLSKALHVDMGTIAIWKDRPEVQEAHKKAIIKFARRRTDVEKILNELDFETPAEPQSLTQINNYMSLSDEQLDALIKSKASEIGILGTDSREEPPQDGEPA